MIVLEFNLDKRIIPSILIMYKYYGSEMKKKICFVDPYYYKNHLGGAEIQMYILSQGLLSRDWEVHYVTSDVDTSVEEDGVFFHLFKASSSLSTKYKEFSDLLNEINADIYYQRGRKLFTYLLGRYSKEYDKKCVFAASMNVDVFFFKIANKILNTHNISIVRKIIGILINLKIDILTYKNLKYFDLILSQNVFQQIGFEKRFDLQSTIFPNLHFKPLKKSNNFETNDTIIWVANIKSTKRPELFLKIAGRLKNYPIRFFMIGAIQQSNYREIISNFEKENKNFKYLGKLSYEKTNQWIGKSTIFVNTSVSISEGFPNTFIQSWLRSIPVITYGLDPDNIIKDKGLGYVCRSTNEIIERINYIFSHKNELVEIKKRVKDFSKRFIMKERIEEFEKILLELLRDEGYE